MSGFKKIVPVLKVMDMQRAVDFYTCVLGFAVSWRAANDGGGENSMVQAGSGNALHVVDFKTARSAWGTDKVEEAAPQLLLYSELARTLANGKPLHLSFAVLTKTQSPVLSVHDVPVDVQQIERTKRTVERVWHAIQGGQFYPAPSPLQCPTCPYRVPCRAWIG